MKFAAAVLFAVFSFSALAGARVVVPSLPEAVRPLAEVETNVVFSTGAATEPAKAGDAVVAPKQEGVQGFCRRAAQWSAPTGSRGKRRADRSGVDAAIPFWHNARTPKSDCVAHRSMLYLSPVIRKSGYKLV